MKKKLLQACLTAALLLAVCCGMQALGAGNARPYTQGGDIKIVNHVVYKDAGSTYKVIDFFDTDAAEAAATSITVISKIDGKKVTAIAPGGYSYRTNSNVTKITLPNTIKKLGARALAGFTAVKTLKLPTNLKTIGDEAFRAMKSLTELTLPKGVTTLKNAYIFYGCTSLKKVTALGTITEVGAQTFYNCKKLSSVNFFADLKAFGRAAFYNTALKNIKLYRGAYFDASVFSTCKKLESVTFVAERTSYSVELGWAMFDGCVKLKTVTFPQTMRNLTLGYRALAGCTRLETLVLPRTAQRVVFADSALRDCASLSSIENKVVLNSIGNYCFANCMSLKSFRVAENVTFVDTFAFYGCKNLKTVKLLFTDANVLKSGFVRYFSDDATVYVKTQALKNRVIQLGFNGDVVVNRNLV